MYYIIMNAAGHYLQSFVIKNGIFTATWVDQPAAKGYFFSDQLSLIFENTMFTDLYVYQVGRDGVISLIKFQKAEQQRFCLN